MSEQYKPTPKTLEKYAGVLVNFALNSGQGIKKGEVVRVVARESAKPLYLEVQKAILRSGGHLIEAYRPDDDHSFNFTKAFYDLADDRQLKFFPEPYMKGLVESVDHNIVLLSDANKQALARVDPKKMMKRGQATKPLSDMFNDKENQGRFTWTLALYGTEAMAREAGLSLKEYWQQISQACFLDKKDPVAEWKKTGREIKRTRDRLDQLGIDKLRIQGEEVDLTIRLGKQRRWVAGGGRNIPSFEIFTSPDWRGTEGWIRFNQPLYRYGNLITGVELEFKKGKVIRSRARKNQKLLQEMINTPGADKVGEFSLTDRRHSRITKFMAETLYDENVGGRYGNTHLALGRSYGDALAGDPTQMSKQDWARLGFNDSAVHTDIVSTANRTVTAVLADGSEQVIYQDGQFQI